MYTPLQKKCNTWLSGLPSPKLGPMTLRGQTMHIVATSSLDEVIDPIFQDQGAPEPSVAFLLEGSVVLY